MLLKRSKYDLESAEGINKLKAVSEMEEKLGEVANFKERSVISPNRALYRRLPLLAYLVY
jgi:hypothetical protein